MLYQWNIFFAGLEPVVGSEQGKTRPVLVISDENINRLLPVVNVLPLTSVKPGRKIYPNECLLEKEFSGLKKDSIVLCYQIRTLDKKRLLGSAVGTIQDVQIKENIIDALCFQLDITRGN